MKKNGLLFLLLLLLLSSCGRQDFPSHSVQLIVPYSPGGTTDLVARAFAKVFSQELGTEVTVVNQAGASGSVGTIAAHQAKPDGYTLLVSADSLGIQRVMGLSELSFDDFAPITLLTNDPKVIVVGKESPYKDAKELFNAMKEKGLTMSYTGPGGSGHVQALLYESLGAKITLAPFPGGLDAIVALLGGQVDFTNSNYSVVHEYLLSGDLKALAVCGPKKLSLDPSVPLLEEQIPEAKELMNLPFTPLSLLVNQEVPQEVLEKLRDAAKKTLESQEWKDYVKSSGLEALYEDYPSEEKMKEFFRSFQSRMSWLLQDAGVTQESPESFGIPRP